MTIRFIDNLIDCPSERVAHGFPQHCSAGFTDGRQLHERPVTRMGLVQLADEQAVRHHDEIHVPGLAMTVAKLTFAHTEFLFPIPVKGLRACPAIAVRHHDPFRFPTDSIRHQHFPRARIASLVPDDQHAHLMVHIRELQRHDKVSMPIVAATYFLFVACCDPFSHYADLLFLAFPDDLSVHFQVSDVTSRIAVGVLLPVHMVHDRRVHKMAIPCEHAGNLSLADLIDQVLAQLRVVRKLFAVRLALLLFLELPEIQRVVLARRADVVGETHVTFRYKDRRADRWRTMRLAGVEFLRRFLMHVLPRGFHKVRYYGLWHHARRDLAAQARLLLILDHSPGELEQRYGPLKIAELARDGDPFMGQESDSAPDRPACPNCGGRRT
jgi:hypothetical protein